MRLRGQKAFSFLVTLLLVIQILAPLNYAYYDASIESQEKPSAGYSVGHIMLVGSGARLPLNQHGAQNSLLALEAAAASTSSPVSSASFADPVPTSVVKYSNVCSVSEMDVAEAQRYLSGFGSYQAEQINQLPDAKLKENDPTNKEQQDKQINVNVNVNVGDEAGLTSGRSRTYQIADIFDILQVPEEDRANIAKEFNTDPEKGVISYDELIALLNRQDTNEFNKLQEIIGVNPGTGVEKPVYENYEVLMLNGKKLPLKDLLKILEQDKTNNCVLDRSHISGKATFQALLDQDLFIGQETSTTTLAAPQHLTSTDSTSQLVNYGGSVLVGSAFESFVSKIGFISKLDLALSIADSGNLALKLRGPLSLNEDIKRNKERINEAAEVLKSAGGSGTTPEAREAQRLILTKNRQNELLTHQIEQLDMKALTHLARPSQIAIYGLLWLGPARFAIQASNSIMFRGYPGKPPSGFEDAYLQVYIKNDKYLTKFRDATDFLGLGHAIDFASDILTAGTPSKAFRVGNVFILNRDTGQTVLGNGVNEPRSKSVTGLSVSEGKWNIAVNWRGKSESVLFEDLREQVGYTSLAMYDSKLSMITTIQNREILGEYFKTLALAAPLLGIAMYGKPSALFLGAGPSALMRLLIVDEIVDLIKPVEFQLDEKCDPEKVDNLVLWYYAFSAASIGESVASIAVPEKSFLQALVSGAKSVPGVAKSSFASSKSAYNRMRGKAASATATTPSAASAASTAVKELDAVGKRISDITSEISELAQNQLKIGDAIRNKKLADPELESFLTRRGITVTKGPNGALDDAALRELDQATKTFDNDILVSSEVQERLSQVENLAARRIELEKNPEIHRDTGGFSGTLKRIGDAVMLVDPIQLGKMVAGSIALNYVSMCRDDSYKVAAYQKIDGLGGPASTATEKVQGLGDVAKELKLGDLLSGLGDKTQESNLRQLLQLRSSHENEQGLLQPLDLYYLNLDGASQQWFGVYDDLNAKACFRECYESKNQYCCLDPELQKISCTDKKSGKETVLSSGPDAVDRSKLKLDSQELARTIIPNKIISAGLDQSCAQRTLLEVAPSLGGGSLLAAAPGSCGTTDCLMQQLANLRGLTGTTSDLSDLGFGKVTAVYTTMGSASFTQPKYIAGKNEYATRFLWTEGTTKETETTLGVDILDPDKTVSRAGIESTGDRLRVNGDGSVYLTGSTASFAPAGSISFAEAPHDVPVGRLLAIVTERGRIEFDPTGRLVAAVHILGQISKEGITSMGVATPAENKDEKGNNVPAIQINNIQAKPGYEQEAAEINKALDKVQTDKDGNKGGFQVFETEDKKYTISTDPATGKPVLTILDKKTGEVQTANITGPLQRDANGNIIVPTDKGNYTFKIGSENGQPMLSVTDPSGLTSLAALLAAKGPGGLIAFDPRTGLFYAMNGQDIPWNPEFAQKGLSYFNSADGARGVPSNNLFSLPPDSGGKGSGNLLSVPSFPQDNAPLFALMLLAVLLGVVGVRSYSSRGKKKSGGL